MKKTGIRWIALALSMVLAIGCLAGCGGGSKKASGAEVNYAIMTDPDNLDASRCDDNTKGQIVMEVQETLVRFDANGELQPAGAEKWTISDDGLVYTFYLRDNQYSDGTQVVAEDYANCLLRTLDPEVGSHDAGTFYVIEGAEEYNTGAVGREAVGVKALDEKTLEITLKEPIPYFIQMVNSTKLTPIPASKTQGADNTTYGSDASKMVYSGPFVIDSWQRGSKIVLKKNPNYWDAASVKLDTINMLLVQEENTRQQMFEQGKLDIVEGIKEEYYEKMKGKVDAGEITLVEIAKPGNSYICFNNQDPEGIFTNPKVRLAFSLAIDRELYVEKVLKKDNVAYGIVPPATNNGDTKFRDQVEEPLKAVTADPKKLLEEGLSEIGKKPEDITVTFLQGNSNNDTKVRSEFFQNQWETKLGVKVKIETAADNATFNATVSKGLYQICNTGWGADYNDPMTFLQLYVTGDGNNAPFMSNATYDELISACKTELDWSVREQKFAEAEKILIAEEASVAPLTYSYSRHLVDSGLKGYSFNGAGGPTVEFKTAYIETA